MLSLRTMIDLEAARSLEGTILLRLDGEDYYWTRQSEMIDIGRGRPASWRVAIEGSPSTLAGWIYSGAEEALLAAADQLSVEGDLDFAMRFADCFALPEEAPLAEA